MKKVLLFGLILAICVFAFPQGVMAADVDISANIVSEITFSATSQMEGPWNLYAVATDVGGGVMQGPKNTFADAVSFGIISNTPFDISVVETGGDGMMESYGGDVLTYPVYVGDGTDMVSSVANTFISDQPADTTGTLTLYTDLFQEVDPVNDVRLVGDNYEITLTFECVQYVP